MKILHSLTAAAGLLRLSEAYSEATVNQKTPNPWMLSWMSKVNLQVMNKLAARGLAEPATNRSELGALLEFRRPNLDEHIRNKNIRNLNAKNFNLLREYKLDIRLALQTVSRPDRFAL